MKKASGIVVFDSLKDCIISFSVNYKGSLIKLPCNPDCNFATFKAMYQAILTIAKNNGFYFGCVNEVGAKFYDIAFIDTCDCGFNSHKYGISYIDDCMILG